jgi:regulator of RNase E activity RraA
MWSPKRQEGPAKIIGPAYTVKYVRKNYENEPKPSGHYVCMMEIECNGEVPEGHVADEASQIDSIPAGAVVFISAPPRMPNACYGGLMSTRAQHSGAVGTVIDGRLRDLQEHRDLDFPVSPRLVPYR